MILKFHGPLTFGDDRNASPMAPFIRGQNVLATIAQAQFTAPVTVAIADERFTGDLGLVDEGTRGYSEYTPGNGPDFQVGGRDLALHLYEEYDEGQQITIWIADEPVNTLD